MAQTHFRLAPPARLVTAIQAFVSFVFVHHLLLLEPVLGASLLRAGGLQLAEGDSRRHLLTPSVQEVEDAVIKTFTYLIELDTGTRNPLRNLQVPCEEVQPSSGPYYLTGAFTGQGLTFPLPSPLRTCSFLEGRSVVVTVADGICVNACSSEFCDCCDGSFLTKTTDECSQPRGRKNCTDCHDAVDLGFLDFLDNATTSATLTDLATGSVLSLAIYKVFAFGPPPDLTSNGFYAVDPVFGYGPDVYSIGPTLFAGYFSLIDPSLLKKGGRYLVTTTSNLYNDGDPVVYSVTVPDTSTCDPTSSTPNQCFNAAGDASVCCAGACRSPPLSIPSCEPGPVSSPNSSVTATPTPAPGPSSAPPATTPTPSTPPSTLRPGAICDPYSSTPNQCFNADGSSSTCCAGSCPSPPGALPYCG